MEIKEEMKKYCVIFDNRTDIVLVHANGIKDCILKVADYCGPDCELIKRAISDMGEDEIDILLNIYNRLSNVDINGIYSIDEVIYEHELIHKFKYCNE